MRPIAEMTDSCLELMAPHQIFDWDEWWIGVIQNGSVPRRKTFLYSEYIDLRNKVKQQINTELTRRKRPERLICPGHGKGIYLINESDVAEVTADGRIRKIVLCFQKGHREMALLAECTTLIEDDRKMLERLSGLVELQQNTMVGTMAKMRSLPPATKARLLKHLGVEC